MVENIKGVKYGKHRSKNGNLKKMQETSERKIECWVRIDIYVYVLMKCKANQATPYENKWIKMDEK